MSVRQNIVRIVDRAPGISVSNLGRRTGLPSSTLNYHLHLLGAAGLISSLRLGRDRHLFPAVTSQEALSGIALLRRRRVLWVVHAVLRDPGLRQRDITTRTSLHRKSLRQCVELLKGEDLVTEVRESQARRYYPTDRLSAIMKKLRDAGQDPPAAGGGTGAEEQAPPE